MAGVLSCCGPTCVSWGNVFTTPLGLTALLGVPLVLALHLFQRRFPRREVSALFLWKERDQSSPSGRRRQKLVRTPSFWCELLAALLLGLALGGPQACGSSQAKHLVVVIDSSASMTARPDGASSETSLADEARDAIEARIDALPSNSRCTLIASGPRPKLLAGPAALPGEAIAALDSWAPGLGNHDRGDALALATEVAGGESVLYVTDQLVPEGLPPNVELLALGRPAGNVAITAATRASAKDGPGERIMLTVQNFDDQPRLAQLEVFVTGTDSVRSAGIKQLSIELEAGGRATQTFDLPALSEAIEISLAPDALDLDNHAWLVPEPARTLLVTTTLDAELRLALGLASGLPENPEAPIGPSSIDRLLELIPKSAFAATPELAHLVIAGAETGGPRTWTLALESPGPERVDLIGPFLKALGSPLVAGSTLQGIVWSHAKGFAPPGKPLISAGDTPLYTRAGRVFHLSLDPRRSTLMRSPDWPVLLTNLAEARRAELPGPARTNLRTGEELRYRVLAPSHFQLTGPDAEPREADAREELLLEMPTTPGLFELAVSPLNAPDATPKTESLAVNLFGGGESDLRDLSSGARASESDIARADAAPSWLQAVLILAALIALVLDGLFLAGRLPLR